MIKGKFWGALAALLLSLGAAPAQTTGRAPIFVVAADFNHDGRGDMISLSGATVNVLLGQANKSFLTATTALRSTGPATICTASTSMARRSMSRSR